MNVFKNKHVVAAMIITPVLAIIAFIATDKVVSEKPHTAKVGESYELIARSNCRYTSGVCTLKNGNFMLDIEFQLPDKIFTVKSNHPLQGVKVGFDKDEPIELQKSDATQTNWVGAIDETVLESNTFQLVAKANDSLYFAENSMGFKERKTLTDE